MGSGQRTCPTRVLGTERSGPRTPETVHHASAYPCTRSRATGVCGLRRGLYEEEGRATSGADRTRISPFARTGAGRTRMNEPMDLHGASISDTSEGTEARTPVENFQPAPAQGLVSSIPATETVAQITALKHKKSAHKRDTEG